MFGRALGRVGFHHAEATLGVMMPNDFLILSGNSNHPLADEMARNLGMPLANAKVERFSDGEIFAEVGENVRGRDVFIIQSTSSPANDHLMELLLLSDALYRSSAQSITAIIPYFGYARQDRRTRSQRVPISASVVANLISRCHISQVLTVDLHCEQIQGFFDIPVDNIYAAGTLVQDIPPPLPRTH